MHQIERYKPNHQMDTKDIKNGLVKEQNKKIPQSTIEIENRIE